jgi:hypothetical protein
VHFIRSAESLRTDFRQSQMFDHPFLDQFGHRTDGLFNESVFVGFDVSRRKIPCEDNKDLFDVFPIASSLLRKPT